MNDGGIRLVTAPERTSALIDALVAVWEDAVRATHHFLTEQDIVALRPCIAPALTDIATLVVAMRSPKRGTGEQQGTHSIPCAFLGVHNAHMDMLFVAPNCRGQGIGRTLVAYAQTTLGVQTVDVNEHNPQAVGFYQHLGFVTHARSPRDDAGRPFPLLCMRLAAALPV